MNNWPIEAKDRLIRDLLKDRIESLESDNAFLRARIRILELRLERRAAIATECALLRPQAE